MLWISRWAMVSVLFSGLSLSAFEGEWDEGHFLGVHWQEKDPILSGRERPTRVPSNTVGLSVTDHHPLTVRPRLHKFDASNDRYWPMREVHQELSRELSKKSQ